MMSDDPPALMNGRVMPVTGKRATTTPMLMNAWMQNQAVIPAASRAPNVSGRPQRDPCPLVGQDEEHQDHEPGPDEPELLADDREDEVVPGVREVQPAGRAALAQARPQDAAEPEREEALDRVEARTERVAPGVEPGPDPLELIAP